MAEKTQAQIDAENQPLVEGAQQAIASQPPNPLRQFLTLPYERKQSILGKLKPEARAALYQKLIAPGSGLSPGERFQYQRDLGLLPQGGMVTSVLPPAERDQTTMGRVGQVAGAVASGDVAGRAKTRFGEIAQEAGQQAQEYEYEQAMPRVVGGQVQGRPFPERAVNELMSSFYATAQVGAKLGAGMMDPKTLAGMIVSKLGPAGAAAAALYFGYQGANGLAEAIRNGQLTPENLQNGLLGMAGVAGAAGMGGEASTGRVPTSVAEVKQSAADAAESARSAMRRISGVKGALRQETFRAAQQYPKDVAAQEKAVGEQDVAKQEAAGRVQQRTDAQRQLETHTRTAKKNVEGVESRAYHEADQRFQDTRNLVGAGQIGEPETSSQPLLDTVREAEAGFEGHPESITLFRQILKMEGDEGTTPPGELRQAAMKKHGIQGDYKNLAPDEKKIVDQLAAQGMKEGEPATWDKLQRIKTSAEEAMRKSSTSPTIKRALRTVDEKVVDMMGEIADQVPNARASWQGARDFWREWREDFHTRAGPKGSASPLTGISDAVDPSYITSEVMRTQGVDIGENRASKTLRKPMYAKHGGAEAADSVDQVVKTHRSIQETPKPSFRELNPRPIAPVETPTVDTETVGRKGIEQQIAKMGNMNKRDIGIITSGVAGLVIGRMLDNIWGKTGASGIGGAMISYEGGTMAMSRLLERPGVQDWLLKKVPPEELAALRKIHGADKVNIANAITDMGVEAARRGLIRKGGPGLTPGLETFIGRDNVRRIYAAAPANIPPAQQIKDLRKILEKHSDNPNMPIGPGQ